jgi:hypothetical protein
MKTYAELEELGANAVRPIDNTQDGTMEESIPFWLSPSSRLPHAVV